MSSPFAATNTMINAPNMSPERSLPTHGSAKEATFLIAIKLLIAIRLLFA